MGAARAPISIDSRFPDFCYIRRRKTKAQGHRIVGMRIERRAESLYYFSKNSRCLASVHVQVNSGITRRMKASNSGTVKPVSPWDGL